MRGRCSVRRARPPTLANTCNKLLHFKYQEASLHSRERQFSKISVNPMIGWVHVSWHTHFLRLRSLIKGWIHPFLVSDELTFTFYYKGAMPTYIIDQWITVPTQMSTNMQGISDTKSILCCTYLQYSGLEWESQATSHPSQQPGHPSQVSHMSWAGLASVTEFSVLVWPH